MTEKSVLTKFAAGALQARICDYLKAHPGLQKSPDIAKALELYGTPEGRRSVTHQLWLLVDRGIVEHRQAGIWVKYRLVGEGGNQ